MVDYLQARVRVMPDSVVVLTVEGELDIGSASDLRQAIASAKSLHPHLILVDLAGVTFCDSSGLEELVLARHQLRTDPELRIVDQSPVMRRTLDLTGLGPLLHETPLDAR